MKKTALILGGTGLVGSHLLDLLVTNTAYEAIYVVSRKSKNHSSEKIKEVITNFNDFSFVKTLPKIDAVFSCLGTTKQQTPNKHDYLAIELGIPEKILNSLVENNNLPSKIHVVSAIGANSNSKSFYMKMKGDLQQLISNFPIPHQFFYQPAVILGDRLRTERWWEKLTISASKGIDKILKGDSMKYHTIHANDIAKGMVNHDLNDDSTVKYVLYQEMID